MRRLVLLGLEVLAVEECAVPEPGPGEILLSVKAATTCGTDLKAYLRGHPQIPMPGPFGHEYSGVVEAAGEGAKFKPGDAVMGVHSAPCLACEWCLRRQENLCETIMATKVLGSFAEYLLIPKRIADLNVFPKPDSMSFERACFLEPLACVAHGLECLFPQGFGNRATEPPNVRTPNTENRNPENLSSETVLVIGPGAIGLLFVSALRPHGVTDITLAGRNRDKLAVGEALGARTVFLSELGSVPSTSLRAGGTWPSAGFDCVIECTGAPEIWERSVELVRRGGKVMFFGGCPSGTRVSFDAARLHYDQITLLSPFHFGKSAVLRARDWLLDSTFVVEPLISGERSLEEASKVFEDLRAGMGIKYVFKP